MIMKNNPWKNLKNNSIKRVNFNIPFDIFWAKNSLEQYCYLIRLSNNITLKKINFKEIQVLYQNGILNELLIILNDSNNWEIFKILCDDLAENSMLVKTEKELIEKTYERLNEWKNLLKSTYRDKLSFEEQMGLFTELKTLNNIIFPKINSDIAINFWRGADKDIQDFLCENSALEVKSTLSSKGSIITISSAFQLETTKNNLFLIFYSLSQTQNGESISDIINYIDKKIKNEEIKIKFYKKLFNIGYNLTETEYDKFRIDKINYYKITDNFPKISSKNLDLRIKEVKYKIDLTFCDSFKVSKKNLEENK